MIDSTNWALFVVASWALIVAPGPDMIYVITRGISQGRGAGLLSAAGVTTGILVHTTFAALGLAALLHTSALAFQVVKFVGAAYLLLLGVRAFLDKESIAPQQERQPKKLQAIYAQGLLSNVLNPKVALFFLAFLPQFIDSASSRSTLQMVMLGIVFALFTILFLATVGYFSGQIGTWIAGKPAFATRLRWLTGGVLVALGIRLAITRRA
ncbi:LysE family translocator [Chloroflexota bacterium]